MAANTGVAFYSFYTGHPYISFIFCFLASGPIVDLTAMRRGLKNKVLQIRLHDDLKTLDLFTAYKKITVDVRDIRLQEKSALSLSKVRKSFEDLKKNGFDLEKGPALGNPVSAFFTVIHQNKQEMMVIDLDPYLYKVDNYDILTDILQGNTLEVAQYFRPGQAK